MTASSPAITSNDVVEALRIYFGQVPGKLPSHMVLTEVSAGVKRNSARYADLVAVGLWASRGLTVHGVEIKVDRRDWLRELADPAKADSFNWCDAWSVAAPPGVIEEGEVPALWGHLELVKGRIKTRKKAPKLGLKVMGSSEWVALLRRAEDQDHNHQLRERIAKKIEEAKADGRREAQDPQYDLSTQIHRLNASVKHLTRELEAERKKTEHVAEWERSTGIHIGSTFSYEVAKAVKLLDSLRESRWGRRAGASVLRGLADDGRAALARIMREMDRFAAGVSVLADAAKEIVDQPEPANPDEDE